MTSCITSIGGVIYKAVEVPFSRLDKSELIGVQEGNFDISW